MKRNKNNLVKKEFILVSNDKNAWYIREFKSVTRKGKIKTYYVCDDTTEDTYDLGDGDGTYDYINPKWKHFKRFNEK